MKFAEKDFSYYWKAIKIPLLVLVAWSIIAIVVAKLSLQWYQSIFSGIGGFIVQIAVFGYIGFVVVADHQGTPKHSAWAGAITGVIAGFIGGLIGILSIFFVPEIFEMAIQQAVAQGAPEAMVRQMTNIMTYLGVVTGPIFAGIIGAILSVIAGAVTKKTKKK